MSDTFGENQSYQLRPTPADIVTFSAANTPLAEYFRPEDGFPIEFPRINTDEILVFDYDYDSEQTEEVKINFVVVTSLEQMRTIHVGVKHGLVGVIGWRVVASPALPEIEY